MEGGFRPVLAFPETGLPPSHKDSGLPDLHWSGSRKRSSSQAASLTCTSAPSPGADPSPVCCWASADAGRLREDATAGLPPPPTRPPRPPTPRPPAPPAPPPAPAPPWANAKRPAAGWGGGGEDRVRKAHARLAWDRVSWSRIPAANANMPQGPLPSTQPRFQTHTTQLTSCLGERRPVAAHAHALWGTPLCSVCQGVRPITLSQGGGGPVPIGPIVSVLVVTAAVATASACAVRLGIHSVRIGKRSWEQEGGVRSGRDGRPRCWRKARCRTHCAIDHHPRSQSCGIPGLTHALVKARGDRQRCRPTGWCRSGPWIRWTHDHFHWTRCCHLERFPP